jgi:Big-like domain-containing protein
MRVPLALFLAVVLVIALWLLTRSSPPVAAPDVANTREDIAITIPVVANDIATRDRKLELASVGQPGHGHTTKKGDGTVEYQPEADYCGTDSFFYRITDGREEADGQVSIIITPVPDPPRAVADSFQVRSQAATLLDVLANDRDPDGDKITLIDVGRGSLGTVQLAEQGILYRQKPGRVGVDEVSYLISDGSSIAEGHARIDVRAPTPVFFKKVDGPSLTEMLAEPGSSIYGSSIHVWVYGDWAGPDEVIVTGHADEMTCRTMSALVFNAVLDKSQDDEDLAIAGAARFVSKRGGIALDSDKARVRQELEVARRREKLLLEIVKQRATPSEDGQSAISTLGARVKELNTEIREANASGGTAFARALQDRSALGGFLSESTTVQQRSGLVQIHRLPAGIPEEVLLRVQSAAKAETATVVGFEDLLVGSGHSVEEAVVIVPVLCVPGGEPLQIRISLDSLRPEVLRKAFETARRDVTFAMIGDAQRRIAYLDEWLQKVEAQIHHYDDTLSRMEAREKEAFLSQQIYPGTTITIDGAIEGEGKATTLGRYVALNLPNAKKGIDRMIESTRELLNKIQEDEAGNESQIDKLAYATMFDSMLREWDLPVLRSQRGFEEWVRQVRAEAWDAIADELSKRGIRTDLLRGENTVFAAQVVGGDVVIRPFQVVDLRRSVVAVAKTLGATIIVDAWGNRSIVDKPEEQDDRKWEWRNASSTSRGLDDDALSSLAEELRHSPTQTTEELLGGWEGLFPDPQVQSPEAFASADALLKNAEMGRALQEIEGNAELKEPKNLGQYLLARSSFLERFPNAPVEMHLALARDLGELICLSEKARRASARLKPQEDVPSEKEIWRVVRRIDENPLQLDAARNVIAINVLDGLEPGDRIIKALAEARRLDQKFVEQTLTEGAMPSEPSGGMRGYAAGMAPVASVIEEEVVSAVSVKRIMACKAHADRASYELWSATSPDLSLVAKELEGIRSDGVFGKNDAIEFANQRIANLLKLHQRPDELASSEVAAALDRAGRLLETQARSLLEGGRGRRLLRDTTLLDARLAFEEGSYAVGLDMLKAAPAIAWSVLDRGRLASVNEIRVDIAENVVTVGGRLVGELLSEGDSGETEGVSVMGDEDRDVVKIRACANAVAEIVRKKLVGEEWSNEKALSEQVVSVLESMHLESTAVALSYPGLRWEAIDKGRLSGDARVSCELDGAAIVVRGRIGGAAEPATDSAFEETPQTELREVLRIHGLSTAEAENMCNWLSTEQWSRDAPLWEQVLVTQVPLREPVCAYLQLLTHPAHRLALLKAMVYGGVLPATKECPKGGRWLDVPEHQKASNKLWGAAVKVELPDRSEVLRMAWKACEGRIEGN